MQEKFFAELAIVAEQVMAQRGVNIDSAFEMCNDVLWKRLGLRGNKGGAL